MKLQSNKIIFLLCLIIFISGCKNNKRNKIEIIPLQNESLINDVIALYAESYDKNDGTIIISSNQLENLIIQIETFIKTSFYNIDKYYECKKNNREYFYTYFTIDNEEIKESSRESFDYIWAPENQNSIKEGSKTGYYKHPYLNIEHEILLIINENALYKELGIALMKSSKSFFMDTDKYDILIEYYLQKNLVEQDNEISEKKQNITFEQFSDLFTLEGNK